MWIETEKNYKQKINKKVTPFAGVWIETMLLKLTDQKGAVTPFAGVWIETLMDYLGIPVNQSHPSRVCGLKQKWLEKNARGGCHTLRGCVD